MLHLPQTIPCLLFLHANAQVLEMFEPRGVSTWVPWRLTPRLLCGLTASLAAARLVPGEETVWAWVKAAAAVFQEYEPDVSGSRGNAAAIA